MNKYECGDYCVSISNGSLMSLAGVRQGFYTVIVIQHSRETNLSLSCPSPLYIILTNNVKQIN